VQVNYCLVIHGYITMGTDLDLSIGLFVTRRRNQAINLHQTPPPPQQVQQASPFQTAPAYQPYNAPAHQANPPQYPFGQPQYTPEQVPYGAKQYTGPTNYYQVPQQQTPSVPPNNVVLPPLPAQLLQQREHSSQQPPQQQYAVPASNVSPPLYAMTQQNNLPAQQQYNLPAQQQYNLPAQRQYTQSPPHPYNQPTQQQYNEYNHQFSSDEPQLQPLYEVPSFYPTIDDMDVASYNPNYDGPIPNTNQFKSAPSTTNNQLSFDDLMQKQLSDQQQQQETRGKGNNGQAYDQFFE
jgi:hypothetical protein